jgi:hypothetical protein
MYYYLYDTFLSDKKYERVLDRIKTRLLDLDIQGKHERLSLLKNSDDLIRTEVKRGMKTIIMVGNDQTLLKVVDTVAKHDVTLGIIPIGPDNHIAETLGIPMEEKSCDVLAARKVAKFDLGQANDVYFLTALTVRKNIDRLAVSHQGYKVIPKHQCKEVGIYNFNIAGKGQRDRKMDKVHPKDNLLDLVIKSEHEDSGVRKLWRKVTGEQVDSIIRGG